MRQAPPTGEDELTLAFGFDSLMEKGCSLPAQRHAVRIAVLGAASWNGQDRQL